MTDFTLEQQRALALARARRRRAEAGQAEGTSGPWEKYGQQATPQSGPWTKYSRTPAAPSAPPAQADPWAAFPDAEDDPWAAFPDAATVTAAARPAAPPMQAGDMVMDAASGAPMAQLPPRGDFPPSPAPTGPARPQGASEVGFGLLEALGDGTRQGLSMIAGAPVDLVNNAPRMANLLPGVDGVGPITENPVGGREMIDEILRLGGLVPDFQPRTGPERIINRMGEELGSTAIPVAGVVAKATSMPIQTVNRMAAAPRNLGEGIAGQFLQPAAVSPSGLIGRETGYAVGGGLGAGMANELAGENKGVLSDLLGSIGGVGATAAASSVVGLGGNVVAGATNSPNFADDVANSAVAERIINSSTQAQQQAARLADAGISPTQLSTDDLVAALRSPAAVEDAVPGYRANIADRTQDPGLATLTYNTDAISPGAASARRVGNEAAVNERMTAITPDGDPGRFRANLQSGVDNQIGTAQAARDAEKGVFESIEQALQPIMNDATARGSSIRAALSDAYGSAQDRVRGIYGQIDGDRTLLDPTDLVQRTKSVDMNLAPNDAKRFRPTEADTIQEMMPDKRAPLRETGLVNQFNRPIFSEAPTASANPGNVPALPGEAIGRPGTTVPMSDVSAIRTGLTDDLRAAKAAGNTQQARVLGRYIEAVDGYLDDSLPEGLRAALDEARTARRDVGDRFERPGTALEGVLSRREGGGYALDDSAVPARFAQPDQGRLTDLRAALAEAGNDPRLRDGLADEVRSTVVRNGLLAKPQALGKFMAERQVLLSEFPELRAQLGAAGASRAALEEAERVAADTAKRLTTPGRSAEASYLKNVEDPSAAIRSVIANPNPRQAVADLASTAASPQAKIDLRAALWAEVRRAGALKGDGMTGKTRWNGKDLRALFDDPKFSAVADELWADDPQDLAAIKNVFAALASAEGSTRARAPGTSGTPQSLAGNFDAALTASSIASRARSVSRGQLSPTIAAVDILGTWLRKRSAQVQSRAIDQITAAVVNNPGMAADLLERYNPATAAARRKMLTQKYGVRATSLLNTLDEAENEDPVLDAIADD